MKLTIKTKTANRIKKIVQKMYESAATVVPSLKIQNEKAAVLNRNSFDYGVEGENSFIALRQEKVEATLDVIEDNISTLTVIVVGYTSMAVSVYGTALQFAATLKAVSPSLDKMSEKISSIW